MDDDDNVSTYLPMFLSLVNFLMRVIVFCIIISYHIMSNGTNKTKNKDCAMKYRASYQYSFIYYNLHNHPRINVNINVKGRIVESSRKKEEPRYLPSHARNK